MNLNYMDLSVVYAEVKEIHDLLNQAQDLVVSLLCSEAGEHADPGQVAEWKRDLAWGLGRVAKRANQLKGDYFE